MAAEVEEDSMNIPLLYLAMGCCRGEAPIQNMLSASQRILKPMGCSLGMLAE